jgi:deoxyribose-phosphate aldolase
LPNLAPVRKRLYNFTSGDRVKPLSEILNLASEYETQLPDRLDSPLSPKGGEVAAWIDHTLLKPEATAVQIRKLCEEAQQYQFAAVCVNPAYVPLAAGLLVNSPVQVCTVVGFPLGASLASYKVIETLGCLQAGASEIDMVVNIGALKGEAYGMVLNEIEALSQAVHNDGSLLKVIIETALLTRREKIIACLLSKEAGADFVKTSTGFASSGATVEDVDLMRRVVGPELGVKAAGGVRSLTDMLAMLRAGATRIGTSAGVQILREAVA